METVSRLNEVEFEIALTASIATTVASFPEGTIAEYHMDSEAEAHGFSRG